MLVETMIDKELRTERLLLRELRPSDAGLLSLYASDARVARMTMHIPHPYPPGLAVEFIKRIREGKRQEFVWAIEMGPEGESGLLGLVSLRPDREGTAAEISYWVAPAFWGTGYASEAVRTICAAAPKWGFETIRARVFQDNAASIKVLMRAGFAYTGPGEAHCVARGAVVPTFIYQRECRAG
jgi:RimJ/RimL family protein N-acetyltransferase